MFESAVNAGGYTRREQAQKLDLELTLLQVLESERGRGQSLRSNKDTPKASAISFLPQIS